MTAATTSASSPDQPGMLTPAQADQATPSRAARVAKVNAVRLGIVGGFLVAWQYVPEIPNISQHISWIDPFFISSPSRVAMRVWQVCTGADNTALVWHPLWFTVYTALLGTAIALLIGATAGLALSNNAFLEQSLRPLVAAVNAIPRIAIVPVVVLIAQSAASADIITAVAVVVGLVFYAALEGGSTVPQDMVDAARLMGAKKRDVIFRIRLPYVIAWVFAALPNAFAFGLVGSVTTELFTGAPGVGHLLQVSVDTADATLTFTVVFLLTIVGVVLVQSAEGLRRKVLPWWNA
jgi:sulfonate transport system permease protein